jgi:rhodanese-related sulfurtransferase
MTRFDSRLGAAALVGSAAVILVLSLVLGHSARAELPPDLTAQASDAGLDVWKAAAFLAGAERPAVVDVRPADAYARYHLPHALNVPGASGEALKALAAEHPAILVYAGQDEVARRLVGEARPLAPGARVHYLVDGARAWYLTFALPVPLFADASPPHGYEEALSITTAWLAAPPRDPQPAVVEALGTLARLSYQPALLNAGKKAPAAGGARKKIGGGCG